MKKKEIKPVRVFAPATVANLACGFDALGLAVDRPGDEVHLFPSDKPGLRIQAITGGELPFAPQKNTAAVAAISVMQAHGFTGGVEMEIHKKMPVGSGLGSSAASAVAGAFAMNVFLGSPFSKKELLPFALDGEAVASNARHADNVAPSLLGGIVLIRDTTTSDMVQLAVPADLWVVVVHPSLEILTREAREILPQSIPLKTAITQWSNLAALVAGFAISDYELISRALVDVVAEPFRAPLITGFDEVKKAAHSAGALGCSISGSGPSVFALCKGGEVARLAGPAMQAAFKRQGLESRLYISKVNQKGAEILPAV
jgi:homoserine kinase